VIQGVFGLAQSANAVDVPSLAASYGPWIGVRTNHVLDSSGSFAGSDGSSRSISTTEDRDLLLALRSRADLIVVDAATARLERYRAPKSKVPLAIFSSSGDFTSIPAVETSEQPIYLFSSDNSSIYPSNPNVVLVPTSQRPFDGFLEWVKSHSIDSILLESGPTLTAMAFDARIVSQSAITITGVSPESEPALLTNFFDPEATLVSLASASGASFTLWVH
jgi:riboflavin biosynthesis pyrimidine reductase